MAVNKKRVVYIGICGINTFPGDSKNWTGKFVTHSHIKQNVQAEKVEYFCGPIDRIFGQKDRIEKLRSTLNFYLNANYKIILVAHSNGCDIAIKALQAENWPEIEELILFSAATKDDLSSVSPHLGKEIKKLKVLIAGKDFAMKLVKWGGFLFGYGDLGADGPKNINPEKRKYIEIFKQENYTHSEWFNDSNFEDSMERYVFN